MRVTRFDRCNLHGPNIDSVVEFSTQVLDFSLTEAAETPNGIVAAFLSCSNKAHDVAFIRRGEPAKFHHVAFSLDSWHEIGQAADIIARYDIPLDIGPARHRHHARPDDLLLRSVWEPQRGILGRVHLLPR
jgi:catechol 2,3-dioxygenase